MFGLLFPALFDFAQERQNFVGCDGGKIPILAEVITEFGERNAVGLNRIPSTVNELMTLAGAVNVCGSIEQEHLVVNMEKIIKGNPQVIVMWHNARKDLADILQNPMWQSLSAVRQRRIFEFPDVFSCDL